MTSKLGEQLKIYIKFLRLNRNSTILALVGLGFSLALISEGLIFTFSFQYGAFGEYLGERPTEQLTVSVTNFVPDNSRDLNKELLEISSKAAITAGLTNRIQRVDWYFAQGLWLGVNSSKTGEYLYLPEVNLYGLPFDYFTVLQSLLYNGSMPTTNDDVILVAKSNTLSKTTLNEPGLFDSYVPVWGGIAFDGQINISGCIIKENLLAYEGPLKFDFQALCDYFSDDFMIINIDNFPIKRMKPICRFSFYIEDINSFNINLEISNLRTLKQGLQNSLEEAGYSVLIYDYISEMLKDFKEEYYLFQLFGFMILGPLVAVSLYLSNYSANLLRKRQRGHIGNLLQRGSSKGFIWLIAIMQFLEITISGIILCFVVAYPTSWLMLKSSGFLAFNSGGILPAINPIIFSSIIIGAFLFSFVINFKRSLTLTNLDIIESHQEMEQEEPIWKKIYLDFVILVIGIVLWLIVKYELARSSAYIFAYTMGILAPVLIIVGCILIGSRLFSLFTNFLGRFLWKRNKTGVYALALFRSNRRQGTILRGLILLSLTFSIIFSGVVSIKSYNQHELESAYYSIGADILVRNVYDMDIDIKNQISNIEGIDSATYLSFTSQIVSLGEVTYSYTVIGIDPLEFASTAYLQNEYLGGNTPENFFGKINNTYDIVMQKDQLKMLTSELVANITIPLEIYGYGVGTRNLNVVNIYNYFPRFFLDLPSQDSSNYKFIIVGTHDLVTDMAYDDFRISYDLIAKTTANANFTAITESLEVILDRNVETVEEENTLITAIFRNKMLYGALNIAFLSSILIVVLILISIVLIQLYEYNREISILKMLGFSPKQFFQLFLTESILLTVFTTIFGVIFGTSAASMITEILTLKTKIPPSTLSFPIGQIVFIVVLLFILAISTTALTVRSLFQKSKRRKLFNLENDYDINIE